jgi:hypothetical protein
MNTIKVANESGRNQFVWCEKHRRYYIFCDVYRTCTLLTYLQLSCSDRVIRVLNYSHTKHLYGEDTFRHTEGSASPMIIFLRDIAVVN